MQRAARARQECTGGSPEGGALHAPKAEAAARHAASLIEAESGLTAEQMKARKLDNQGAAQVLTAEANALAQRDQALTQALRDQIGGGRKVAIHILEFFDRIGYTRRVRDTHVLRGNPEQFGS